MRPAAAGLQERLAHHLRGIRNRYQINFFVQRAHQHSLPESLDGPLGLPMTAQPDAEMIRRYRGA